MDGQTAPALSVEEIWKDDHLDRRAEAELLAGYIESLLDRPGSLAQKHAYTIAIDAGYGEGKTFFLRRLAAQLAITHPVAFIDAWADDLADQPLIALTATLAAALAPYMKTPEVQSRWSLFLQKSGRVAKIAGIGVLKRGLGFLITHTAAELAAQALAGTSPDLEKAVDDKLEDAGQGLADDLLSGLKVSEDMAAQVAEFQAAQNAISEMKRSLLAVAEAIRSTSSSKLPIVIVIDELDRCRPSYAIKLLEEIKHLFDVPGLVFLYGLHGEQLSHSVQGAYGPSFDGKSYLKRFINRRYSLRTPTREALISTLVSASRITRNDFYTPTTWKAAGRRGGTDLPLIIDVYAQASSLSARDMFELIDLLETSVAVARPYRLILPYFLPLVIGHMKNQPFGEAAELVGRRDFTFVVGRDGAERGLQPLYDEFKLYAQLADNDLVQALNAEDELGYVQSVIAEATFEQNQGPRPFALPRNYPRLISAVGRFEKQ